MQCPYCEADVKLIDSKVIYGKSYGLAYICSNYPKCDAYVGVNKITNKPLGTLANSELREYRKNAHKLFDELWKCGKMTRTEAYNWLSNKLNLDLNNTHIGQFDINMCKKVIDLF